MFVPLSYSFESFWKIVQWNASLLATAKPRAHMKTRWGGSNSEDVVQAHIKQHGDTHQSGEDTATVGAHGATFTVKENFNRRGKPGKVKW